LAIVLVSLFSILAAIPGLRPVLKRPLADGPLHLLQAAAKFRRHCGIRQFADLIALIKMLY
jgi:hypothetical protein